MGGLTGEGTITTESGVVREEEFTSEQGHEVEAIDWDRRLFDDLIPLPDGTSYNAYLVEGEEKTALLDTVSPRTTRARFPRCWRNTRRPKSWSPPPGSRCWSTTCASRRIGLG